MYVWDPSLDKPSLLKPAFPRVRKKILKTENEKIDKGKGTKFWSGGQIVCFSIPYVRIKSFAPCNSCSQLYEALQI